MARGLGVDSRLDLYNARFLGTYIGLEWFDRSLWRMLVLGNVSIWVVLVLVFVHSRGDGWECCM